MKPKILFVLRHEYQDIWKDGLFKAIELLSYDYDITVHNLIDGDPTSTVGYDFVLGWGAFGSQVDYFMHRIDNKKGLCIAGTPSPTLGGRNYDILFYETDWYKEKIKEHPRAIKAFGINTDIYKPEDTEKFFDYITVGAFALWKRQHFLLQKEGRKLAIGEIQKDNPQESLGIIARLLAGGVFISDMVEPEALATLYNMSKKAYIPASVDGGGERAVLEARACGIDVEVESDNLKLQELLDCPIYDQEDYFKKLKEGIELCL